jgi:hypothetical protein
LSQGLNVVRRKAVYALVVADGLPHRVADDAVDNAAEVLHTDA